MKTKVLEDYRDTQSGPCLIIGNGPSLNDIPLEFSGAIPTFACNFFPMYVPNVFVDYLVMIDKATMVSEKLWDCIRPHTVAFCFAKWAGAFQRRDNVAWWANKGKGIDGFSYGDVWGQYFPTSAHAACWIADIMGFDDIYLIGMDGTSQARELSGVDEFGKSAIPHFYDDHPAKDSILWDMAWGNMAHYLMQRNKSITNLSTRTAITQLLRRDYLDFFESDTGRWKRPWRSEYPRPASFCDGDICDELVAGAPSDNPGTLDGVGHMVPSGSIADLVGEHFHTPESSDSVLLSGNLRGEPV